MSWPAWPGTGGPLPTAMAPVQSTIMPAPLSSAPAVMAPMGYTQEQWAQAQQQNWQQWAQWQQQYQQWHQQYGAEYHKSISAMQGTMSTVGVQPPLPAAMATAAAPPLPENQPPLPPEEPHQQQSNPSLGFATGVPKPTTQTGYSSAPLTAQPSMVAPQQPYPTIYSIQGWQQQHQQQQQQQAAAQKRPHVQESEYDQTKKAMLDNSGSQWNQSKPVQSQWNQSATSAAQANKANIEELSEAEKKFDKEFAAWEAQFNKWKEQNANHPDKTQYKEYEQKWESWRNSLLERREQMRRKRLALAGHPLPAVTNKLQTYNQYPTGISEQQAVPDTKSSLLGQYPGTTAPHSNLYSKPPPVKSDEAAPIAPQSLHEEQAPNSSEGFLTSSTSADGIPGLDLVKEDSEDSLPDRSNETETVQKPTDTEQTAGGNKGPDFEAISKGINSILGDQKLLSMLSMVAQNTSVSTSSSATATNTISQNPVAPAVQNTAASGDFVQNFTTAPPALGQFAVPPPTHQAYQYPTGNFSAPPPLQSEGQYNYPNQTTTYYPPSGNFNNIPNKFTAPPPTGNFYSGSDTMRKSETNSFVGKEADNFDRGTDNFNRLGENPPSIPLDKREGPQRESIGFNKQTGYNRPDNRFGDRPENRFANTQDTRFGGAQDKRFGGPQDKRFGGPQDKRFGGSGRYGQNANFDDYEEEDDYERYNELFKDEDDQAYQNKYEDQKTQQMPKKIPGLMDIQVRPAGLPNFPPPQEDIEDKLFEPVTVIDYDHKSKRKYEEEINVVPIHMFDYGHEPVNRVSLAERPKWLAESFKFIREFDPDAPRFVPLPAKSIDRYSDRDKYEDRFNNRDQFSDRDRFDRFDDRSRYDRYEGRDRVERYDGRDRGDRYEGRDRGDRFEIRDRVDRFEGRDRGDRFEGRDFEKFDARDRSDRFDGRDLSDKPEARDRADRFEGRDRGDRLEGRDRNGRFEGRDRCDRYEGRDRSEGRDRFRDRRSRRDRSFDRTSIERGRSKDGFKDIEFRGADYDRSRDDRRRRRSPENRKNESNKLSFSKNDSNDNLRSDLEEFSDTDMDFEQNEVARHAQGNQGRRSQSPELSNPPNPTGNQIKITMIEDILNSPGRFNRPPRIVIILRGPPGSGKTFLAKQIKDKEVENGGSAPRILSLDDYFMNEQECQIKEDGKMQTIKKMVYEYEAEMEESYRSSFMKSFKKTITDGYFPFIIVDNVNDKVKHFGEMWSFAKQNGFQVYICQLDLDPEQCFKRNIHNRNEKEIEDIIAGWEPTPSHHPTIDASSLLQNTITEVEMEVEDNEEPIIDSSVEPEDQVRSKWDNFDCSSNNLAKLDGVHKPLRRSGTMEEYLQLEDQWQPPKSQSTGKKRVRWADLEEQREQEKMRAIGFVVGHTDWDRMMDPTEGKRALAQTKYFEKNSRF